MFFEFDGYDFYKKNSFVKGRLFVVFNEHNKDKMAELRGVGIKKSPPKRAFSGGPDGTRTRDLMRDRHAF